jgi:hypothetical protein
MWAPEVAATISNNHHFFAYWGVGCLLGMYLAWGMRHVFDSLPIDRLFDDQV